MGPGVGRRRRLDSQRPRGVAGSATGVIIGMALLAGCATSGVAFDPEMVPHIRNGQTTDEDARRWFGSPRVMRSSGNGGAEWRYFYEEKTTHSTGTITKLGRSIASIFGWRTIYPPLDVEYSNRVRHRLDIWFDELGVVTDYEYERLETPSTRIY